MDEAGMLFGATEPSVGDTVDSILKRETLVEELSRDNPDSPVTRDCDDSLERGVPCTPFTDGELAPVPLVADPDVGEAWL